jgi:microcystin-dependent protein
MDNLKLKENLDLYPTNQNGSPNQGVNALPQTGFTIMYAGNIDQSSSSGVITTTAPDGWYLCNGDLALISENPVLFSILGTDFGGNGTTTFGLPDFSNRYAGSSSDVSPKTVDGSFQHSHLTVNVASPTHGDSQFGEHTHGFGDIVQIDFVSASANHTHSINAGYFINTGGTSSTTVPTGSTAARLLGHTHSPTGINSRPVTNNYVEHTHYFNNDNINYIQTTNTPHSHETGEEALASFQSSSAQYIKSIMFNFIIKAG